MRLQGSSHRQGPIDCFFDLQYPKQMEGGVFTGRALCTRNHYQNLHWCMNNQPISKQELSFERLSRGAATYSCFFLLGPSLSLAHCMAA